MTDIIKTNKKEIISFYMNKKIISELNKKVKLIKPTTSRSALIEFIIENWLKNETAKAGRQ